MLIFLGIYIDGDIRPFHSRQVAVKDCNPYKATVEEQMVIDPIIHSKFLTNLGLDDNSKLLSVKDTYSEIETEDCQNQDPNSKIIKQDGKEQLDYSTEESESEDSDDSDDPDQGQNPIPAAPVAPVVPPIVAQKQPAQNIPVNGPDFVKDGPDPNKQAEQKQDLDNSSSSESEYHDVDENLNIVIPEGDSSDSKSESSSDYQLGQLFELVEVDEEDELLLRDLIEQNKKSPENSPEGSDRDLAIKHKLVDLEKLIISSHDEVRKQAEFELRQRLDQYREERDQPRIEIEDEEKEASTNSDSEITEDQDKKVENPTLEESDTENSEDKLSKVSEKDELEESDRESTTSEPSHITEQSIVPEDSWPCPSEIPPPLDARQRQSVVHIDTQGCRITVRPEDLPPEPPPRPREIRGRRKKDIWEWVSQPPDIPVTPQVGRRGRTIKPRTTYSPEREEQRQKKLRQRDRQRVLDNNRVERDKANLQTQAQEIPPLLRTEREELKTKAETSLSKTTTTPSTRSKTRSESDIAVVSKTPVSKQTKAERPASVSSKKVNNKKEGSVKSKSSRKN